MGDSRSEQQCLRLQHIQACYGHVTAQNNGMVENLFGKWLSRRESFGSIRCSWL